MQILSVLPEMIAAIEDELQVIKSRKIGKNINIYNGFKKETESNLTLYTFELAEEKKLFEDSPIKLHAKNNTFEGTIVGTEGLFVTLALDTDPGGTIDEAILEEDITALYIKMIERLNYIKDNTKQFFVKQTESLFFPQKITKQNNLRYTTLFPAPPNDAQANALNNALSYPISCIWGPPGTGKTKTLSMLVTELLQSQKTILVVAHANRAVDNALYAVLKLLRDMKVPYVKQQELITRYTVTLLSKVGETNLKEFSFYEQIEAQRKSNDQNRAFYKALISRYESLEESRSLFTEKERLLQAIEELAKEIKKVQAGIKKYSQLSSKNKLKVLLKGHERATLEKHQENLISKQKELNTKVSDIDTKLKRIGMAFQNKQAIQKELKQLKKTIDESGGLDVLKAAAKKESKINVEEVLEKKQVIFTTLTKLATDEAFKKLRFSSIIIDEASMAPLPLVALAASLAREHLVFAGDPQQLPPITIADTDNAKQWLARDIFMQTSGAQNTDQLFKWQEQNSHTTFLDTQYRMPETLSNLVSKYFYQNKIMNANTIQVQKPVQIVDTGYVSPQCERDSRPNSQSRCNPTHVQVIKNVLQDLSYSYSSYDIGIITPYRLQVSLIRKMLKDSRIPGVEAGTIHTFQGREKKVIIFDTADSPPERPGIMLDEKSRKGDDALKVLTVAFSRAQEKLVIIANVNYIKRNMYGRKLANIIREYMN